jgi:hypothetical protein
MHQNVKVMRTRWAFNKKSIPHDTKSLLGNMEDNMEDNMEKISFN